MKPDHDSIVDAWLHVIARDGWLQARIDAVARTARCSIDDVAAVAIDRWDALRAADVRVEHEALAEAASDPDESIRNRLFALLMARFDAMQEHHDVAHILHDAARRDPALAIFILSNLPPMIRRLVEAAGVDAGGLTGPLRVTVLLALYVQIERVWLDDDSVDLAATMKALDSALARAERLANFLTLRNWRAPKVRLVDIGSAGDQPAG